MRTPNIDMAKALLYPLIGTLHLATVAYTVFSFTPELGVVMAGLIASTLIGLIYFTPPLSLLLMLIKRCRKGVLKTSWLKWLATAWFTSVALLALAEIVSAPIVMMTATAAFVLATKPVRNLSCDKSCTTLFRSKQAKMLANQYKA